MFNKALPGQGGKVSCTGQQNLQCTPVVNSRPMTRKLHRTALRGLLACQCACLLAYLPRNILSYMPARIDACQHACLPVALPSHDVPACLGISLPSYRLPACPPAWHPQIATVNASAAQQWISAIQSVIDKVCRWYVPDCIPMYFV